MVRDAMALVAGGRLRVNVDHNVADVGYLMQQEVSNLAGNGMRFLDGEV